MKVTNIRTDEERALLTALITHDGVLGTVHAKLGDEQRPFESKWANQIASWCRTYYARYQKAPKKDIRTIFTRQAEKIRDEDTAALIETFLVRLSKDHEASPQDVNERYTIDQASAYFERVRLTRLVETLTSSLENKDLEESKALLGSFQSVDFAASDWVGLCNLEDITQSLRRNEEDRTLIKWPGPMDRFLSSHFERGGFVSFAAPEKRGKSFWLLKTVHLAIRQRRKVLYYVFGDMSQDQVSRRWCSLITALPSRPDEVKIPTEIKHQKEGPPKVEVKVDRREAPTIKSITAALEKIKTTTAQKEIPLKMRCTGASVISAGEIERDARQFAAAGWVPDVIVIDYADLLAPEAHSRSQDYRHQINESWKVLRRISLDLHCLVVTATQSAATAYGSAVIGPKDFSEDKRKNAHVTGMLGINQTAEEKALGLYRLNWVFLRDGAWTDKQVVWTAGNLAIANPCIISSLR